MVMRDVGIRTGLIGRLPTPLQRHYVPRTRPGGGRYQRRPRGVVGCHLHDRGTSTPRWPWRWPSTGSRTGRSRRDSWAGFEASLPRLRRADGRLLLRRPPPATPSWPPAREAPIAGVRGLRAPVPRVRPFRGPARGPPRQRRPDRRPDPQYDPALPRLPPQGDVSWQLRVCSLRRASHRGAVTPCAGLRAPCAGLPAP
jgi:hypothetical protein